MIVDIKTASHLLDNGQVVAVPTETVYGLAARYDDERGIRRIFEIKKRPSDHPLIIHIGAIDWLNRLAKNIPSYVDTLIKEFWPGPLTLILEKNKKINPLITATEETVAIRMPSHPVCLELLDKLGQPIVAPSANPYCRISPTTADHVSKYFNQMPVLDGGACRIGVESTIVLATDKSSFQILRPGLITQEMLEEKTNTQCTEKNIYVKAPGNQYKHYSPNIPLIKFTNKKQIQKYINDNSNRYLFMLLNQLDTRHHDAKNMSNDPEIYSTQLYAAWHEAEDKKYDAILIEMPSNHHFWIAINDRINKASSFFEG